MGLKDDIEAMERHAFHGTLRAYLAGTAPILDVDGKVIRPAPPSGPARPVLGAPDEAQDDSSHGD